jgi:polysaccharide deacetylase family protein (PEP-CTERM system associated)
MLNALTIDVEDYFHVTAFERCISPAQWDSCQLRVEDNTLCILDLLDEFGVKATFFVLGWVAERKPGLVKEIAKRGHEVASHGYGHRRVYNQTQSEFRDDIRRSKSLLEEMTGEVICGYRAPSYSISHKCLWAYDELVEAGYRYDSSVFPISHDLYGIPDWPRYPFTVAKGADGRWGPFDGPESSSAALWQAKPRDGNSRNLREIPITTLSIAGKSIPIAGGGYFRLFPYAFTKWGLKRINRLEQRPFVFYLHPWEIDPDQPRMKGAGLKSRIRHYLNLRRTESRFRRMLADFRFATISEVSGMLAT